MRLKKQVREIRQEMSQRIAGMQAFLKSADALDDDSRRAIIKALREESTSPERRLEAVKLFNAAFGNGSKRRAKR